MAVLRAVEGKGATKVWNALSPNCGAATSERVNVAEIYKRLALPPFGLREGPAPILMLSALIAHGDELALYEHGTFRPRLSENVCERLLRNPRNFEVKCFASIQGNEKPLFDWRRPSWDSAPPPASEATASSQQWDGWSLKSTCSLRTPNELAGKSGSSGGPKRIMRATEPDVLLFEEIPAAFGEAPIPATKQESGYRTRAR